MPVEIPAPLTRKLGPLPAWGWGVAIGGAILVAKVLRKPASAASGATAPTSIGGGFGGGIGGTGTVVGTGPDATTQPGDPFSGPNSLIMQLQSQVGDLTSQLTGEQSQVAGLSGTIATLTNFQTLQTKLTQLLSQRSDALYQLNRWQTFKNTSNDALRACTTTACKTQQQGNVDTANTNIQNYTASSVSLNGQITDLQTQLNGLGATS